MTYTLYTVRRDAFKIFLHHSRDIHNLFGLEELWMSKVVPRLFGDLFLEQYIGGLTARARGTKARDTSDIDNFIERDSQG